ncbi:MAG: hypothetical protein HZA88_02175 [Verrucomicrobia bacterium]|nr:hypothetical protein [Verrucomicrobiota bacterium]
MINISLVCWLVAACVSAQTIQQLQQRLGMGKAASATPGAPAGRGTDVLLVEKPWEQITDRQLFDHGKIALGQNPSKWHHAETEHFVIHFHKRIDAQKVARQAEFYYEQVKKDLMVEKDRFDRKSHIFLFEKDEEWHQFVAEAKFMEWSAGVAYRSELYFLSRRDSGDFAASTLAHEMTHCVFYRFVPKRIPMWLNEGFSEFESGNAYAKFKGIGGGNRGSGRGGAADYPLQKLLATKEYPKDQQDVHEFYRTSERLVRFLMTKLDRNRFVPLVMKLADGASLESAVLAIYPDKFKSFDEFVKRYEKS